MKNIFKSQMHLSDFLLFSNMSAPLKRLTSAGAIPSAENMLCVNFTLCHSIPSQGVIVSPSSPAHGQLLPPESLQNPSFPMLCCCLPLYTHLISPLTWSSLGGKKCFFIHPYVVSSTAPGVYLTRFLINKGKRGTFDRKSGVQVTKHQPERASEGSWPGSQKERAFLLLP